MGYPGRRNEDQASTRLTPRECRERGLTYQGALMANVCYQVPRHLDHGDSPAVARYSFSAP